MAQAPICAEHPGTSRPLRAWALRLVELRQGRFLTSQRTTMTEQDLRTYEEMIADVLTTATAGDERRAA